jgi:5-methyltetrahydrofolate--homocysteine methyltransferase
MFGVKAVDTGDHNNPDKQTSLVLDESFDPSSEAAQIHLRDFCADFSAQDFVYTDVSGTDVTVMDCPINRFDEWLQEQSSTNNTLQTEIYEDHCNEARRLPMDPEAFHPCLTAWADRYDGTSLYTGGRVFSRGNNVKIIIIPFYQRVRFDSPFDVLDTEWNLIEKWVQGQNQKAPQGVSNAFTSSIDFWWYDTTLWMVETAKGSAGIAIGAAAVVIFVSSRSIAMTLFSVVSVGYILTSVAALMFAAGWTLGFLESICFAILIGISVDFVIHFSHAYTVLPGDIPRGKRTKYALVHMGPSVLAAGFTTASGAVVMLFTTLLFFRLFATALVFTVLQATVGSFVVFLVLADCIGPSNPTLLWDTLRTKFRSRKEGQTSTVVEG